MAYHHGQLHRAMIDAALELVREGGPKGLTLRAAARRAGVSVAAPYRHFADKEALLAAVALEGFTELVARLEKIASEIDEPVERLKRLGIAYVRFATDDPARYRVMFGDEIPDRKAHPELEEMARRSFGYLAKAVADGHARGLLEGGERAVTLLSWSVVHGLASLLLDGQARVPTDAKSVDAIGDQLGTLLLVGVVKRPRGA
ncbi:MAG: TetR/AcrR family transcriptional regulator [Sandaracinaceae bacterium]|nr:TetR/AcrR family transcriptional regulator [Sandaracinaceae bacterium]